MKKTYIAPSMELERFETCDVITVSVYDTTQEVDVAGHPLPVVDLDKLF